MKTIQLLALIPLATFAFSGFADELKIGAGPEDGEYTQTIVPAIDAALSKTTDLRASAVISPGSQANVEQLLTGELSVALIQLDVLALNSATDENLQVLGLIAPEALLCAAKEGGKVRSYYNLTDKYADPLILSIGAPGSGSARTMEFLLSLDSGINPDKFNLVYESNTLAELDRLAAGSRDLVCFVRMPNPDNEILKHVVDSDELFFIDFVNASALEPTYGDEQVYQTMLVPVSKGVFGLGAEKVDTLTTWVALVARSDIDPQLAETLRTIAADPELLPPTTAAGKAKRMYSSAKEKTSEFTQSAKEKAADLTAKAKAKAIELKEKVQGAVETQ
ncbi:MAG: TAXI family TRAP transporter solute-binding subunit [Gammaproteobacteria bacterium]